MQRFQAYVVVTLDGYGYHNEKRVLEEAIECRANSLTEAIETLRDMAQKKYRPEFQSNRPIITIPKEII